MFEPLQVVSHFSLKEKAVLFRGDCTDFLKEIPDRSVQLVVTSPPYNIGKEDEKRLHLEAYVAQQRLVLRDCVRILRNSGSRCWQVGNYVEEVDS